MLTPEKEKPSESGKGFSPIRKSNFQRGLAVILNPNTPYRANDSDVEALKTQFLRHGHTLTECDGGGYWVQLCHSPSWPKYLANEAEAKALLQRIAGRAK